MRYVFGAIACLIAILCMFTFGDVAGGSSNDEYLRIHIRANSNLSEDQSVKYAIKDKIVDAMVGFLAYCETKEEAEKTVKNNLSLIEEVANKTLIAYGFSYKAKAFLRTESFPTRSYQDLTLESGIYDALILELGEAKGDNWWCVVYPPLCFVQNNPSCDKVVYKSRIIEIINSIFG
ncbi:MAG: stage II sporulation protein R [Clostridia bacterium]